jgi:transcriptional regulator with XRE-family HTH domain
MTVKRDNTIGKRIKELRTQKRMTQSALADELYVSDKVISKWENDKSIPDVDTLLEMSELFGVSIEYLLTGESQRKIFESKAGSVVYNKDGSVDYYLSKDGDRLFTRDEVTTILKKRIDRYQQSIFAKYKLQGVAEMDRAIDLYHHMKDAFESASMDKGSKDTYKLDVKCRHCGNTFTVNVPTTVDVRKDKDTKRAIINEDFYNHRCPCCHKITFQVFPFTYIDDGYTIYQNDYEELDELFKKIKSGEKQVPSRYAGATSYLDFCTTITAFDNDMDYRIAKIYLWFKDIEISKDVENGYIDSSYLYERNGKIYSSHRVVSKKDNYYHKCHFDIDMYKELREKYLCILDTRSYLYFDDSCVNEFLESLKQDKKVEA